VVSIDLENFFELVNHNQRIEVLLRTIEDGSVISLIHKYLGAGEEGKKFFKKPKKACRNAYL
jgi:hypothetical protein